jgi:nitroimidazol reductase NimA-like FMN-containing flavoprotein (pyridoxamine 5'-phosphate oxidase superfamily)
MYGELSTDEIDEILRSEILARIACVANGWPYIVPVTYVYDGASVYIHSAEGLKLRAMREEPRVCIEVEQIRSTTNCGRQKGFSSRFGKTPVTTP